jgi:hypothetical protein
VVAFVDRHQWHPSNAAPPPSRVCDQGHVLGPCQPPSVLPVQAHFLQCSLHGARNLLRLSQSQRLEHGQVADHPSGGRRSRQRASAGR